MALQIRSRNEQNSDENCLQLISDLSKQLENRKRALIDLDPHLHPIVDSSSSSRNYFLTSFRRCGEMINSYLPANWDSERLLFRARNFIARPSISSIGAAAFFPNHGPQKQVNSFVRCSVPVPVCPDANTAAGLKTRKKGSILIPLQQSSILQFKRSNFGFFIFVHVRPSYFSQMTPPSLFYYSWAVTDSPAQKHLLLANFDDDGRLGAEAACDSNLVSFIFRTMIF